MDDIFKISKGDAQEPVSLIDCLLDHVSPTPAGFIYIIPPTTRYSGG